MKFGEDLTTHLTPEWRKQYLAYDEMKGMLYDAVENAPAEETDAAARERYIQQADERFFGVVAGELRKVELFYNEKLADALRKLHELQKELDTFEKVTSDIRQNKRRSVDDRKVKPEDQKGLLQGLVPLGKNTTRVAEKQHSKTLSQIKFAFSEYYLSLTLLNNYQAMNRTGFRKILKKHDKLMDNGKGGEFFQQKVGKSKFVTDKETERLIEVVEKLFTDRLEKGDRQTAMKKLRVPPLSEQQSAWTTFRLGLWVGSFLVLVLIIVLFYTNSEYMQLRKPEPKWVAVRLFRGFLIMFLNIWLMGLNVYGWQQSGVNHVLIFEIDPRNHLTYQSLMEVASLFCVTWALCVLAFLYTPAIAPTLSPFVFPLILMAFCVAWMLNPMSSPDTIVHRSSRYWFLRKVFSCFTAPFNHVTFADFWLGDQMNSLTTFFLDMEYFACFYAFEFDWSYTSANFLRPIERNSSTGVGIDFATGQSQCLSNAFGIRPIVSLIPATVRFLQCLRRYRDTGKVHPHLVNAGKYSTSYFVVVLGVANSWYKSSNGVKNLESPFFYIWVMSYIVSFTYTFSWDVWMDWSLMDPTSKVPFLRDELIYGNVWYYYGSILNDFLLRLGWVLNVSLGDALFEHQDVVACFTSLAECWRRFIWNFLRLENEHVNNCGQFRAVRDISLKPIKKDDLERIQDRLLSENGVTHRGGQLANKPLNQRAKRSAMPSTLGPTDGTASLGQLVGANVQRTRTNVVGRLNPFRNKQHNTSNKYNTIHGGGCSSTAAEQTKKTPITSIFVEGGTPSSSDATLHSQQQQQQRTDEQPAATTTVLLKRHRAGSASK